MKIHLMFSALFVLCSVVGAAVAQTTDPQAQALKQFYNFNKRVLLAAAEKMPAEHYGFKPAGDVRSFAELMGHIADGNYLTCSAGRGEANPNKDEIQKTEKTPKEPPQFDLDTYQFAMLKKGPKWTPESTPETQQIQAGHMANIQKMARLGKLMAAGPMADNGELRGLFIFKAAAIEEAKTLAAEDPAIKSGRLTIEFLTWMAPKGIGAKFQEELQKGSEPKVTMTKYYLVLFGKGTKPAPSAAENQQLMLEHLWNIRRQLDAKVFMTAGPFAGNGDLRGLLVIAANSLAEAKTIAEADPMVKAGQMSVALHTWWVAKEVWP